MDNYLAPSLMAGLTLAEQFTAPELALQQSKETATVLNLLDHSEVSYTVQAGAEARGPNKPNLQ